MTKYVKCVKYAISTSSMISPCADLSYLTQKKRVKCVFKALQVRFKATQVRYKCAK